jgi:FHA domain-containing protein
VGVRFHERFAAYKIKLIDGAINMNTSTKICPVCNKENDDAASVCVHCGAWLEEGNPTKLVSIPENLSGQDRLSVAQPQSFIDMASIPEDGLGVYVAGEPKPFYVSVYKKLILGRGPDSTLDAVLDLSDLNAANLGVSRRHAMIQRSATGFEVVDLASRNGTWLNAERLTPNRPYPFPSGSQLRVGQMRLLIMYHSVSKG